MQDFSLPTPQDLPNEESSYFTFKEPRSGLSALYSAKIKVSEHLGRAPIFGTFSLFLSHKLDKWVS